MAGTILENLSGRKLLFLTVLLFSLQVIIFLLGGVLAPSPSNVIQVLTWKCLDHSRDSHPDKWFSIFNVGSVQNNCNEVQKLYGKDRDEKIVNVTDAREIVFVAQVPLVKEGVQLTMSRWFQHMTGVLYFEVAFDKDNPDQMEDPPSLLVDVRMAYKDHEDTGWTELGRSVEERRLECSPQEEHERSEGYHYSCPIVPLFETTVFHDYYLVNMRLPIYEGQDFNTRIGLLDDVWLVIIHQNGGFTQVWLSLKTLMFPLVIGVLAWFWNRVRKLPRQPVLMEKILLALGISLTLLNLPLEWLSLVFYMPFIQLMSDLRQGLFYTALLAFWLVFAGEHMLDDQRRDRLAAYYKHLAAVAVGCLALFVFDICERGVQLGNPFYTIWATETGSRLAMAFIALAGIAAAVYFVFLCYMVWRVLTNISLKRNQLPNLSQARRKFYEGIIYRFKFLMLFTLVCAVMTIVFFILSQVAEGSWRFAADADAYSEAYEQGGQLEYTSAFFTGVYGMWNIYVVFLLAMYAPSHKFGGNVRSMRAGDLDSQEEIEFDRLSAPPSDATAAVSPEAGGLSLAPEGPTEGSALTAFAQKAALD